jgi:hypothetical protein
VRFENRADAPWPVGTHGDLASGEVFLALGNYGVERLVDGPWRDITPMGDAIAVEEYAAAGTVFHFNADLPWTVEPGMLLRITYSDVVSSRFSVPDELDHGRR